MMQTQQRRMNMRRYGLVVLLTAAVTGIGTTWVKFPGAAAQTPAVTPKMQAPPEARSLSHAFSSVAKALRPSVVRTDVAVVRLEKAPKDLVVARIGNSDRVEVGEWVLAVGSPLGMDQTVTAGIISSKGKLGRNPTMRMSGAKVREYIQTDAKIN